LLPLTDVFSQFLLYFEPQTISCMRFLYKSLIILMFPLPVLAQVPSKAITLKRFIEKVHYAPRQVNDEFSLAVFTKMLEETDPFHIYFDETQLASLSKYRTLIDDELNGKTGNFCRDFAAVYHNALINGETIAKDLLVQPFKYDEKQFFTFGKQTSFAKDAAGLKQRWQQYLQWRMLTRIYEQWEFLTYDSTTAALPSVKSEWFSEKEVSARRQLAQRVSDRLKDHTGSGPKATEEMVNNLFLHVIAQCFDPHTDYFDSENKKEFTESLSSDVLEFGFTMESTDDGEIVITDLKPGSAAWNSGNIYADDKIVQIKTKQGKVVNPKEAGYNAVSKVLDEAGSEEIELTLRSADGNTRQVKLAKQEVQNEENLVRGYLLNGQKKIGYIALPSFYTSWDEQSGSGCANDLSKEIIKLKREKIEGLVLDLRYNGGGSIQEAIEIAGIFIEAGPMLLIRDAAGNRATLKDPSRGSIYDGPLMVLINGQSASASELVAATLQDYKRAVIMGGTSFGKATMQVILPLDTAIISNRTIDENKYDPKKAYTDYVKVTTGKLYRVNGSTNQQNGVLPDVQIPDAFSAFSITERNLDYALESDTITKTLSYTPINNLYPIEKISSIKNEILNTPYFSALNRWLVNSTEQEKAYKIPLSWEAFAAYEKSDIPPTAGAMEKETYAGNLKVENTSYTNRLLELENEYVRESNKWVLEDLLEDPYIRAAYFMITSIF
jgi:carboxyl-terminal processing protease